MDNSALDMVRKKPVLRIWRSHVDGQTETILSGDASKKSRQRSTIAFPYMDLESAIKMADAIHSNVGHGECSDDQLAAWTGQSGKSSTFRVQISASTAKIRIGRLVWCAGYNCGASLDS